MQSDDSPFPAYWIGGDLGDHRPCDGTYSHYPFEELPPLPYGYFDGRYRWLLREPTPLDYDQRHARAWSAESKSDWNRRAVLTIELSSLKLAQSELALPASFTAFISDADLVSRMHSATDCGFILSDAALETPRGEGRLVPFLEDSQGCWTWYLHISYETYGVVAACEDLQNDSLSSDFWQWERQNIVFCAESFEAFLYRYWIENEIWFRLVDKDPALTSDMKAYLQFYN